MLGHALLAPPRPAYPAPATSASLRPQHGYYTAFTAALEVLLGPGGHGISFSYGDFDADADAALGEAGGGAGLRVLLRTGAGFLRRESLRVYGEPLSTPTPPSILPFSSIAPAQP